MASADLEWSGQHGAGPIWDEVAGITAQTGHAEGLTGSSPR